MRRTPLHIGWPLPAAAAVAIGLAIAGALVPVLVGLADAFDHRTPIALVSRSVLRGLGLSVVAAIVAAVLAWPVARALPAALLLGWAMLGAIPRSLATLATGLAPGPLAVVLATVAGGLPWIALLLQLRLRAIDPAWLDAARDLGATPWQRWRRVQWPLARPTLGFGALWVALQSSGDVTTYELAGGGKVYSAALLLRDAVLVDDAPGVAATLVLVLAAWGVGAGWWVARQLPVLVAAHHDDAQREGARGSRWPGLVIAALVAAPLLALVPDLGAGLGNADRAIAARLGASAQIAAALLVLALPLGACAAVLPTRRPVAVATAMLLPLVIPAPAYGLAALASARALGLAPGLAVTIVGSLPTAMALVFVATVSARARVGAAMVEAAANLGASPWARLRRLWLPRLGAAWLAAGLLVVAWCWADAAIAPFTSGPGDSTVAVAMTLASRGADADATGRWALLQVAITAGAVVIATRLWRARSVPWA